MKYRCDKVESRSDGTGDIAWDIWAIDDDGNVVSGEHKTVLTPWDETQVALASGANALKELLRLHAGSGWDDVSLTREAAANLNSINVAESVNNLVGDSFGGFPVEFSL